MKKIIPAFTLTLFLLCAFQSKAQTTEDDLKKEIGIRFSGLNDFDFMYKKQKGENNYRRVRFMNANVNVRNESNVSTNILLGSAIGFEKRKSLNDKLSFVRGSEIIMTIQSSISNSSSQFIVVPGLGIVLGFQYDINENFYVNLEAIPSLTASIEFNDDAANLNQVNLGFNTSNAALGVMYRF